MKKKNWVRTLYLYTFSLIGLILIIMASVSLINLVLKETIFTEADEDYYRLPAVERLPEGEEITVKVDKIDYKKSQRQRDLAQSIASLLVGIPLYLFHWKKIDKEKV